MKKKRRLLAPLLIAGLTASSCSGEERYESARVVERGWEGRSVATQTVVDIDRAVCHPSDLDDDPGFFGGRSESCKLPDDATNIRLVELNIGCAAVDLEFGEFQYDNPGDYDCWDEEDSEGNTITMGSLNLYEYEQAHTEQIASCTSTSANLRPNKTDFKLALIPEQRCAELDVYKGRDDITITHYPYSYFVVLKTEDGTRRYQTTSYHYREMPVDRRLYVVTGLGGIVCYAEVSAPEPCMQN